MFLVPFVHSDSNQRKPLLPQEDVSVSGTVNKAIRIRASEYHVLLSAPIYSQAGTSQILARGMTVSPHSGQPLILADR